MEEEQNVEGTTAPFGTELEAEEGAGNEREEGEGSAVDDHRHTPIVWQKREEGSSVGAGTPDPLALQREANAKRAQRFGIDFKEPSRDLVFQVKRYKNPFGPASAAVGVDPFSEEEQEKRRQRAQKFGSTLRALQNAEEGQSNDAKEKEQEEENEATEKADNKGDEDEDADDEEEEVEVEEGMDVVAASEERKDVGDSVARRMDTIHLYGTDDMSTENVFKHFFEYSPSYVEWINDSSCNVVFPDEAAAKRALFSGCNSPLPFSLDEKELYSWKQGKPWRGRPIMLRLATVEDRKPLPHEMAPRHRSRWSASTMRVSSGLGKKTKHRERGEGRSKSTTTRKERRSRDRKSRKRRGDKNETQNTSAKREPPSRAGSISLEGFSKVEMEERNQLRSQRFKRELASVGGGSAFLPSKEEEKRKEREEDDEEEVEL